MYFCAKDGLADRTHLSVLELNNIMNQALDMVAADHGLSSDACQAELMGGKPMSSEVADLRWSAVRTVVTQTEWDWAMSPLERGLPIDAETTGDAEAAGAVEATAAAEATDQYNGDDWDVAPRVEDGTPGSHGSWKTAVA